MNTNTLWPSKLRDEIVRTFKRPIDERKGNEFFDTHGWPPGLRQVVILESTCNDRHYYQ